jgi:hypothetical protein
MKEICGGFDYSKDHEDPWMEESDCSKDREDPWKKEDCSIDREDPWKKDWDVFV